MFVRNIWGLVGLVSLLVAQSASAQGVLIWDRPIPLPRPFRPAPPEANYKVSQISIDARLQDQVADVQAGRGGIVADVGRDPFPGAESI